jgi:hypothetical protein
MTSMVFTTNAQNLKKEKVVKEGTSTLAEKVMNKLDLKFKPIKHNRYKVKIAGHDLKLIINNSNFVLLIYLEKKASLNRINDFNAHHSWVRAYLGSSDHPALVSELSFEGGITIQRVHVFFNTYESLLKKFVKQMK